VKLILVDDGHKLTHSSKKIIDVLEEMLQKIES